MIDSLTSKELLDELFNREDLRLIEIQTSREISGQKDIYEFAFSVTEMLFQHGLLVYYPELSTYTILIVKPNENTMPGGERREFSKEILH